MAKKVTKSTIKEDNEVLKLVKLIVVVSLIVVVFYAITVLVNNKKDEEQEQNIPATIQYDYILAGNILKQPNDEYYVLAKMSDDLNTGAYEAYLYNYKNVKDAIRVYYIDLDNPLNSKFIKEESKFDTSDPTKLQFKETTLLLVEDGKIQKTYEGKENITKLLSEITKTDED